MLQRLGLALIGGFATFFLVSITVTELLLPYIEFSLFVGLPMGLLTGVFIFGGVYLGLRNETLRRQRRIALATSVFSCIFLIALIVVIGVLRLGALIALGYSSILGAIGAILIYGFGRSENGYLKRQSEQR